MATRIVWNKAEKADFYNRLVELFASKPHLDAKTALREAQSVLDDSRRRKVTDGTVFVYKAFVAKARAEAKSARQPETVAAPQSVAEPTNPLLKIFDDLLDVLADRIADRLRDQMTVAEQKPSVVIERGYVENRTAGNARERLAALSTPSEKQRKPSVLVVGLNGCQMGVISKSFPELDFTFMTGEDAVTRNRAKADHTVLMTKFINHGVHSKYRTVPNLHYCNGGVSDLNTMMYAIRTGAI